LFLEFLQELHVLLEGVGEVVGEINLLLEFNTKVKLVISVHLHAPHVLQLHFFILYHLRPSFLLLVAHAGPVILLELFILSEGRGTLAKYSSIFMRRMTTGRSTSLLACRLKWKKVLEDCFSEYWVFMGSSAGVRVTLPSINCAFSKFPESKFELIFMVEPATYREKSLCRDSIIIYLINE
jgi:hypothetical protein